MRELMEAARMLTEMEVTSTLWVNAVTGEIIDCEEEGGAAHHNEYLFDNPGRLGVSTGSPAFRKAYAMEYEDMIGYAPLTKMALRQHWTRCNVCYSAGSYSIDAVSEQDVYDTCMIFINQGRRIDWLCAEVKGDFQTYTGKQVAQFFAQFA